MGGKPIRAWQQICFCIAGIGLLHGCSLLPERSPEKEIRAAMVQAKLLLNDGDYPGAQKEFEKLLNYPAPPSPADWATFNLAVIHAHPKNPKQDPKKALAVFRQVTTRYPESIWSEHSKVWIDLLQDVENTRQELAKSQAAIEKSRQEIEKSKQALDKTKQELEKTRLEAEKSKQMIEKSKQVDIEIEQKRRQRGR